MHVVVVCLDQYPVLGLTLMWGSMCDLEKGKTLSGKMSVSAAWWQICAHIHAGCRKCFSRLERERKKKSGQARTSVHTFIFLSWFSAWIRIGREPGGRTVLEKNSILFSSTFLWETRGVLGRLRERKDFANIILLYLEEEIDVVSLGEVLRMTPKPTPPTPSVVQPSTPSSSANSSAVVNAPIRLKLKGGSQNSVSFFNFAVKITVFSYFSH